MPDHAPPLPSAYPLPDLASGRPVTIASTKYDGSPHYEYKGVLLDEPGPLLRCFVPGGTRWRGYRGEGVTEAPYTLLFFTDGRWYNIYHQHRPVGRRGQLTYANVALPPVRDGDTIRWVDLDVDVVCYPHGIEVHDEDEFAVHRERWGYPPDLVDRVRATTEEMLRLAHASRFPFDRASHLPPDVRAAEAR